MKYISPYFEKNKVQSNVVLTNHTIKGKQKNLNITKNYVMVSLEFKFWLHLQTST